MMGLIITLIVVGYVLLGAITLGVVQAIDPDDWELNVEVCVFWPILWVIYAVFGVLLAFYLLGRSIVWVFKQLVNWWD